MSTPKAFDPRVALATASSAQPGIYALLLGWGSPPAPAFPPGGVWCESSDIERPPQPASQSTTTSTSSGGTSTATGRPWAIRALLDRLAIVAAGRRNLLAGFFEPTSEDRDKRQKVPGPAHRAVAQLVARGPCRSS